MKLAVFDEFRVGLVSGTAVHDISGLVPRPWAGTPFAMNAFIRVFEDVRERIEEVAQASPALPVDSVRWLPPVPAPGHVFAAPLNYQRHVDETAVKYSKAPETVRGADTEASFFLKAPGSIVGARDTILLPEMPGYEFHHEPELALVIGKEARGVKEADALSVVFGYTCLLDITLRNSATSEYDRSMRKSFETFTPMGPVLVTADEIPDPGGLDIRLWVNDGLRQSANTRDLISSVPELVAQASRVLTLRPGDVYSTGTPGDVGPLVPGDQVTMSIENVGRLSLPVEARPW